MAKKTGLGRGIGNFLTSSEKIREVIEEETSKLMEVDLADIVPNEDQPRKNFDKDELNDLSKSIEKYGVIQPLLLKKKDEKYEIIAGERRYRAAIEAGLTSVPAIVKDVSDEISSRIAIIENIQRKDLNPVEEAMSYKHLLDSQDLTQKELADEIGKSRQYIGNTIRLLKLDPRVLKLLEEEKISTSHGKNLLSIKDGDKQYKEAMKIIKHSLPVNDNSANTRADKREVADIFMEDLRNEIERTLGTKVSIKKRGKIGKIEIEYYGDEDLSRIADYILQRALWLMKRFYTTYLVSAFSDRAFMGNSTGVVIDDGRLTDLDMENIAKDINQSVIVFVRELDRDRYLTRFFTPHGEINLCGHATVATFYALAENEYIKCQDEGIKKIIQHTKIGKIPVELEYKDGKIQNVYMNLDVLLEEKFEDQDRILKILNLKKDDIGLEICENLTMEKISTGTCDILVPVKDERALSSIVLNKNEALRISEEENIISIHAFTTKDGKEIKQRTFSPIIGEDEEFGSGTSTAATMYYLSSNKITEEKSLTAIQGDYIGRISKVYTSIADRENRVRVGGRAYVFMNGVLYI